MKEHMGETGGADKLSEEVSRRIFNKLRLEQKPVLQSGSKRVMQVWTKMIAAAVIVAVLSAVFYYIQLPAVDSPVVQEADIPPGGNRATLVLADGKELALGELRIGDVADQGGVSVKKTADGMLEYLPGKSPSSGVNVIRTPKGGQYGVVLPDGSKVWLNAASSITYAASFGNKERTVKLVGEAYFEVLPKRHNGKSVPFYVETDRQRIEVLGTRFNVNAYNDGNGIKTTLIDGKVKVITEREAVVLQPSQELNLRPDGISTRLADVDVAIDWKNGDFIFAEEDIATVMRKVSRWYNVEVVYQQGAGVAGESISGQISRNRNLSEVLRMLELSAHMRFEIRNNQIHVYSNQ